MRDKVICLWVWRQHGAMAGLVEQIACRPQGPTPRRPPTSGRRAVWKSSDADDDPLAARIAEVLAELVVRAGVLGIEVTSGDRVSEAGLATLIGYTTAGLKHARWYGRSPLHRRVGRRVRYALADVARWLVESEEN